MTPAHQPHAAPTSFSASCCERSHLHVCVEPHINTSTLKTEGFTLVPLLQAPRSQRQLPSSPPLRLAKLKDISFQLSRTHPAPPAVASSLPPHQHASPFDHERWSRERESNVRGRCCARSWATRKCAHTGVMMSVALAIQQVRTTSYIQSLLRQPAHNTLWMTPYWPL